MKAVWVREIGPFENVKVEEVPDPSPALGEVIIDVAFAETNYPDMLVIEGKYQHKPQLPFAPGKAVIRNRVCAAVKAQGVSNGTEGRRQRVAAQVEHGAFAEKARVVAAKQLLSRSAGRSTAMTCRRGTWGLSASNLSWFGACQGARQDQAR